MLITSNLQLKLQTVFGKKPVEIANGIWEEATYFGSTTPKEITSLKLYKDKWVAQIQKHTSRDQVTGQFKGKRRI